MVKCRGTHVQGGRACSGSQFEGIQSVVAGKRGGRRVRWPVTFMLSREAESGCSHSLLFIYSRFSAHRMVPPAIKKVFPSLPLLEIPSWTQPEEHLLGGSKYSQAEDEDGPSH